MIDDDKKRDLPRNQTGAISSGPFEISPDSFSSPPVEPPIVIMPPVATAHRVHQHDLSLSAIVGIGCGIFVVLVVLVFFLLFS